MTDPGPRGWRELVPERAWRETLLVLPLAPTEVDTAVSARMARQSLLREPGRRFTLVTTEGALRWCAESATVMADQVDHIAASIRLADLARYGNEAAELLSAIADDCRG